MALLRSLRAFAFTTLIITAAARIAPLQKHQHQHRDTAEPQKRQVGSPIQQPPRTTAITTSNLSGVLTYITPSPGATPIAVTQESQIVTSFVPKYTLCELPPIEFFPVSSPTTSVSQTVPFQNYSISIPPGNGTCTTIFSPTITMVCATTLTALAEKYTVTNCNEDLTFSTEYGYVLVTPTATSAIGIESTADSTSTSSTLTADSSLNKRAPDPQAAAMITPAPSVSIETLTTYYLAPWQQLTAGTAPTDVDLKVCRKFSNGTVECIREYQVWETSLVTFTTTSYMHINISTTIHGSSQVIIETFIAANVTDLLTTFSFSTTMELEFETEFTTTNSATRMLSTSTQPTVYRTLTVEEASKTSSAQHTTSTTTLHLTSTVIGGTSTVTLPYVVTPETLAAMSTADAPPEPNTSVDFASMLGIGN